MTSQKKMSPVPCYNNNTNAPNVLDGVFCIADGSGKLLWGHFRHIWVSFFHLIHSLPSSFFCVCVFTSSFSPPLNNVHELSDVNGMMKMVEARVERKILRWLCVDILLFCSCKDDISSFIVNECQLFLFFNINVGNVSAVYDILRWKIVKIMEFQFLFLWGMTD